MGTRDDEYKELERLLRITRDAEGAAATNPEDPWRPTPDSGCPVCDRTVLVPHPAIKKYLETFTPEAVRKMLDDLMYMFDRESG